MDTGWLKGIAPLLGTALAGPLGGAAAVFLADKLGAKEKTVEAIMESLNAPMTPEQLSGIKMAEIEFKKFLEQNKIDMVKIQAEADKSEQENLSKRHEFDMTSDSKLSKNIRPMTLIFILFAYSAFALMSAFDIDTKTAYVELLGQWGMLIMSFYFGGRSFEKIAALRSNKKEL